MRIRPHEKSLYFSTTFHIPFLRQCIAYPTSLFSVPSKPSSHFLSSAPSSPRPLKVVHFLSYLHSSAPSSPCPISIRARLRALVLFLFERAFEPSTIKGSAFPILPQFEHAFEPSSYFFILFFSSAPSSPRPSQVVHFLSYLLLSASPSPHFLRVFIY